MSSEMDHFTIELQQLDETQERVEAVSDEMLNISGYKAALQSDEPADILSDSTHDAIKEMIDAWMHELCNSDINRERLAFLYVANHVLQKLKSEEKQGTKHIQLRFIECFCEHMTEAVSLVSNSPMDRQIVMRLLKLWHEKNIFKENDIWSMWKCTGEDIPDFLEKIASFIEEKKDSSDPLSNQLDSSTQNASSMQDVDAELSKIAAPELPMKLNAHSVNPVLDASKQIDYCTCVIRYLDEKIHLEHQYLLNHGKTRYKTPDDILNDRTTSCQQLKQRIEGCLRLVTIRNKFAKELPELELRRKQAAQKMMKDEKITSAKVEAKLEQSDTIDIGLADLVEHREKHSELWEQEAAKCNERKKKKEEEQKQKEEEITRLHQEAIAESAKHAQSLESDINQSSSAELKSLSRNLADPQSETELKHEDSHEMVWHPVLKELVPLQSLNLEWEDWRDH